MKIYECKQVIDIIDTKVRKEDQVNSSNIDTFGKQLKLLLLHHKQLSYQVHVTESMYHLVLDMSFLHCICGKVTSVSQSSDPFNKLIWCLTSFNPDLLQLIDPASLRNRMVHEAIQKLLKQLGTLLFLLMHIICLRLRLRLIYLHQIEINTTINT